MIQIPQDGYFDSTGRPASARVRRRVRIVAPVALAASLAVCGSLLATSVIPISDPELYRRADVVVHGVVTSSDATVDDWGRPETLTFVEPISVLKGNLAGPLVLHQLGGTLPDGRFFQMWGRPEYVPGREVIVFAIARPQGEYETAEMLLGKFEVWQDEAGARFAIPDLAIGVHPGVDVHRDAADGSLSDAIEQRGSSRRGTAVPSRSATPADGPRELASFLRYLRSGARSGDVIGEPMGRLERVRHPEVESLAPQPLWGNISNQLWRYNNNATAAWSLNGTANITGGGIAEATGALASWTTDPFSNINYTVGSGTGNVIYLNATSSALGCGWSSCLSGGGVIGCGGPFGGGSNSWRGDTYSTITGGTVELRAYCSLNGFDSITTQSVLAHELGHTLGLGHSDQNFSPHDACTGDESAATMRSVVQHRTTLGTDDQDAIRWIYGDGLNHCGPLPAPTVSAISPTFGSTGGGARVTITGANFQSGASVTIGGPATGVVFVNSTTLTATTASHAAGAVDVIVTNPDTQAGRLTNGFTYDSGVAFYTVTPCRAVDTRDAIGPYGGPALVDNANRTFTLAGRCGIPSTARAVAINVAVTQSTAGPGFVTLYQGGTGRPVASTINYSAGQTRGNNAIVPLGAAGDAVAYCGQGSGTVHLILDVNGYFQ